MSQSWYKIISSTWLILEVHVSIT